MKKIIIALLLLFSSSTLYPIILTQEDIKTARAIQSKMLTIGGLISILGFGSYVYQLPFRQNEGDHFAANAAMKANFIQWIRPLLLSYGIIPFLFGITPIVTIDYIGDLLAIAYIAHKYHGTYRQAKQALKEAKVYLNF